MLPVPITSLHRCCAGTAAAKMTRLHGADGLIALKVLQHVVVALVTMFLCMVLLQASNGRTFGGDAYIASPQVVEFKDCIPGQVRVRWQLAV